MIGVFLDFNYTVILCRVSGFTLNLLQESFHHYMYTCIHVSKFEKYIKKNTIKIYYTSMYYVIS